MTEVQETIPEPIKLEVNQCPDCGEEIIITEIKDEVGRRMNARRFEKKLTSGNQIYVFSVENKSVDLNGDPIIHIRTSVPKKDGEEMKIQLVYYEEDPNGYALFFPDAEPEDQIIQAPDGSREQGEALFGIAIGRADSMKTLSYVIKSLNDSAANMAEDPESYLNCFRDQKW